MFLVFLLLVFNFAVSWWNAYVTGQIWIESKALGGWARLLAWSGAVQSAMGFTMVLAVLLASAGVGVGLLTAAAFAAVLKLTYLLIIFPVLGTGLVITIEAWIKAYRDRSLTDMGVAAYNTFATVHNSYGAFSGGISGAASDLSGFFDADDVSGMLILLVVAIVATSLVGGCLLTRAIMKSSMGSLPLPIRETV